MKRINKEIKDAIIKSIEGGGGVIASCRKAGIHPSTFYNWITEGDPLFDVEFFESYKKAKKVGIDTVKEVCEGVILKAAQDKDRPVWQAAAWILERKFHKEYAEKHDIDHTTGGNPISITPIAWVDGSNKDK